MTDPYYGGLTSQTGSVGGGGDGSRHDDDRGVFFPEFNRWARLNNAIMKTWSDASVNEDGIEETITIDLDFNDGAYRPSSTLIANGELPKRGEQHPTITGCYVDNISIKNYNNQPDHFRCVVSYRFPEEDDIEKSSSSSGGSNGSVGVSPLDTPFLISWSPVILNKPLKEDLGGVLLANPNGEPYDISLPKVRLDGTATWNQKNWDQEDLNKFTGKVNSNTWTEGEYKFDKHTILCNYVVGNLQYYNDENGDRRPYYKMTAGISYYPEGVVEPDGTTKQRAQGSFYFDKILSDSDAIEIHKFPKKSTSGEFRFDLDADGMLKSGNHKSPITDDPYYQYFNIYESINFNFVDR